MTIHEAVALASVADLFRELHDSVEL